MKNHLNILDDDERTQWVHQVVATRSILKSVRNPTAKADHGLDPQLHKE